MAQKSYQTFRLEWNGDEVKSVIKEAAVAAVGEFGLLAERNAKAQLSPGRGVLTGRLQRSIHAAPPNYNWAGDWAAPGRSAPERGGVVVEPAVENNRVIIDMGTGIFYGTILERRLQFLKSGWEQSLAELPKLIEQHSQALLGK